MAYHFHWPLQDILNLEHDDRRRFIEQISAINRRMNRVADPALPTSQIPIEFWTG